MALPILQVRGLTTQLLIDKQRLTAVDSLSFDLNKGRTLALVGESGSGKSMTALSLLRITPKPPALPSSGQVIYQNTNLLFASEAHMRTLRGFKLAMIFQDPSSALNPVYTIGQQLAEVATLHLHASEEQSEQLSLKALIEVGIGDAERRLGEYPHQLSGGMRQRVMMAMALLCHPDVLIADEPTTALDVTLQAQVIEQMKAIQQRYGMAILLITHDLGVVAEMAHDVIVMYASRGVEGASIDELFDKPLHPYTQGLFRSRPHIAVRGQPLPYISGRVPSLGSYPSGCPFHPRCPHAMPKCKEGDVPVFHASKSHWTRCWLYEKEGEGNGS